MEKVNLTIDGMPVAAAPGANLLDAALAAGLYIPHLCHHPDLAPYGVCRLCAVEIEGRGVVMSCLVPVAEGLVVRTEGPAVDRTRRMALELLLANHPSECVTCRAHGDCELQRVTAYIGIEPERVQRLRRPRPELPVDASNPFFDLDHNKCILCGICVRTCDEIQGLHALDYSHRGFTTAITTFGNKPMAESVCESCGECVSRCPVAALVPKQSLPAARSVKTICIYCGVGCGVELGVRGDRVVSARGDRDNPVNHGRLCVKGRFGQGFINHPDRLTRPLVRHGDGFEEVTWDEALALVAGTLGFLKAEYGPDSLAFLSSAKCSNEENYLMQKLARAAVGTNNVDHCARLCHASTVAGLAIAFGSGAMTNSIGEIAGADVIFIIGSNTTESHPIIGLEVRRAARRGQARVIVADPRRIPVTRVADLHLRQQSGTDVALLNGMMHVILAEKLHDADFVRRRTEDFDAFAASLGKYTPEYVEAITGVPRNDIAAAARIYAQAEKATILYAMGITQHTTGTDNVKAIANLAMLTGNLGRESTGVNPLRGQNNVQGACDMGALPNVFPGYQAVTNPELRARFEAAWEAALPGQSGLTVVEMIHAAAAGKVRGLYVMGENPMMSDPDVNHVRQALESLDFLVVQDLFLSETAQLADVVLPAASYAEKDGTVTNTERRVQAMHQAIPVVGEARPDWQILGDVATGLGYPMAYDSPAEIMEEIAALTPSYGGIHYDRLNGHGLQWPCPDRGHPGTPILHRETFTRGKGRFHAVEFIEPDELVDDDYPLRLSTGRALHHYHTILTRKVEGLNILSPSGTAEVNTADAGRLGLADGALARISSRRGTLVARAQVSDKPPPGTVFMTFHFVEAAANLLTNSALDPIAKIPEYKVCAVRVEKV
ncbi:MAG: formate dehydrogenase subunit alpha [Gemmatimonadota bacterium]